MKKLFALLVVATLTVTALAQSPQRMSYQAVVRNNSGVLMANQAVGMKISILQGSATGTAVYVETHSTTTNANGLATIEIGGGTIVSGSFSGIAWSGGTYFIKTETDPAGGTSYTIAGTSQILSVPYALYAKTAKTADYNDLTNKPTTLSGYGITDAVSISGTQTISGTTTFKGTTPDMEEALFDVKNKDGQTIFAVYNEGVRIWVADGAKGSKGGFAVGGFDQTKGVNTSFFNVELDTTGILNPSENRILWYPLKNAFLTGKVLIESKENVGENSFASGYESKAVGDWSQALGYKAIARGNYSTAIGKNAVANCTNSFAFGDSARATKFDSYALGRGSVANGLRSFAFGSAGVDSAGNVTANTQAIGDYSIAIGQGSQTLGKGAFTLGLADTASGDYSLAMGYRNRATGYGATSMGFNTMASEGFSTAFGYNTLSSGGFSTAMGIYTKARGYASTAMGYETTASEMYSTAIGFHTVASGPRSIAMGDYSMAVGSGSFAIGRNTTSSGMGSVALGHYTSALSPFETVIGIYNTPYTPSGKLWSVSDRLFVVGNGTVDSKGYPLNSSDALTILKNGYTGIGTSTPKYNLEVAGEIASSNPDALRMRYGVYGTIFRQDELDMYLLVTNAGDKDGDWNSLRPFRINLSTGNLFLAGNAMAIQHGGNVGIGTSTPNAKLEVLTSGYDAYAGIGINSSVAGGKLITLNQGTAGKLNFTIPGVVDLVTFDFVNSRVGIGSTAPGYKLTVNGTAWCSSGAWTGSDIRWKENILPLTNVLSEIQELNAISYDLKTDEYPEMGFEKGTQFGLIAQDVEKIYPELVRTDNNGFKSVSYEKLSVVLLEAVKEQQLEIDELKQLVQNLLQK